MTSTVKANLKPCPFCGGHATLIYDNQEGYRIYCDDCDIMTDTDYDKDKIIDAWNKRV
ncbi:Lar family restriction alleviation protein [uncultured Holdemanella sp.]|uniref:Lar family restriction alleviation protein n=1 Tax=uncultured Holdemanella sp. TaxID=1763549 RepID=UPI0025CF60EF|nr:Lar family restriction alleviation protein [uncultured Holdemanella sp.]